MKRLNQEIKQLVKKLKKVNQKQKLEIAVTVLLLVIGVFFRTWGSGNYPFGFDQVQILEAAEGILQGNITLIGPRTGPANLFTGPLIYYLTAPVLALFSMEVTVVVVPTLLAVVTALVLAKVLREDFALREKILFLSLWAFSPYLVRLDRVFWNPNLMLLAAGLAFFPLVHAKRKHFSVKRALLFVIAGSLGYQAHFAGFLLPVLVTGAVLLFKKNSRYAIAPWIGLGLSVLPTLVFDLRNDWLNTRGVLALIQGNSSGRSLFEIISDVLHSFYILIENMGKLMVLDRDPELVLTIGITVLLLAFTVAKKRQQLLISSVWLVGIVLCFGLYSANKPEYYYVLSLPALMVFIFRLTRRISANVLLVLMIIFFGVSTQTTMASIKVDGSLSLGSAVHVRDSLLGYQENGGVARISYDMPHGSNIGYVYAAKNIVLAESGRHVHVSYPNFYEFSSVSQYGGTATWEDPRTEGQSVIVFNQGMIAYPDFITRIDEVETDDEVLSFNLYEGDEVWAEVTITDDQNCAKAVRAEDGLWFIFSPMTNTAQVGSHCYTVIGSETAQTDLLLY